MCEQFETRVTVLENQVGEMKKSLSLVSETRPTFLKEMSKKHEDFIQIIAENQEILIKEEIERKISRNEANPNKTSPRKPTKTNPSAVPELTPAVPLEMTPGDPLAPNKLAERSSMVKDEGRKTDKETFFSRLSPSAEEFVLPKNNPSEQPKKNPPYSPPLVAPTLPGHQVDVPAIYSGLTSNHSTSKCQTSQDTTHIPPACWYTGNGLPRMPNLQQHRPLASQQFHLPNSQPSPGHLPSFLPTGHVGTIMVSSATTGTQGSTRYTSNTLIQDPAPQPYMAGLPPLQRVFLYPGDAKTWANAAPAWSAGPAQTFHFLPPSSLPQVGSYGLATGNPVLATTLPHHPAPHL